MKYKVEKITPYNATQHKSEQIEQMFDNIAPAYDIMNRAMTLGLDCRWRKRAVKMLQSKAPKQILDVACGTGDMAAELYRALRPERLVGIDLSDGMMEVARRKFAGKECAGKVTFEHCDCLKMPYDDGEFDAVTSAFGVRNFEHLAECYREMWRVLAPGGVLCVIELSQPTNAIVKPFYKLYTRGIIPLVGRLVSSDKRAYSYLPESIAAVPQGNEMLSIIAEAGFSGGSYRTLTFGVCTIYMAFKK